MDKVFDVFLSFKHTDENGNETRDFRLAKEIYQYFEAKGISTFFSTTSLQEIGTAEYQQAIDDALDSSKVLIAIGTSRDNLNSKWVRYEWESFFNDLRSGYKKEGYVFGYIENMELLELPRALRQVQVIKHKPPYSLRELYIFIQNILENVPPPPPPKKERKFKLPISIIITITFISLLLMVFSFYFQSINKFLIAHNPFQNNSDSLYDTITVLNKDTNYITAFTDKEFCDSVIEKKDIKFDGFTDSRDMQNYKTVKIGNQVWMAENLNYNLNNESKCYNNISQNCEKYGRLYTYKAAQQACPTGWYLPEYHDWEFLVQALGGDSFNTNSLKVADEEFSSNWNKNSTNESGFSVKPAGWIYGKNGTFHGFGSVAYFWVSSEKDKYFTFKVVEKKYEKASPFEPTNPNISNNYFSVRCIKDERFSVFIDPRDGQIYKTVKIGNQIWMAENFKYDIGDGCYFYDNDPEKEEKYGRLYTWNAAKGACPEGWHLPGKQEFNTLLLQFGGRGEKAFYSLTSPDLSGFNAVYSGWKCPKFEVIDKVAVFWSKDSKDDLNAWILSIFSYQYDARIESSGKKCAFSVRYIKD